MPSREEVDVIITADHVVTMDGPLGAESSGDGSPGDWSPGVIADGAVAVRDSVIVGVGPQSEILSSFKAPNTYGGKGKALIPGLVNTHTHAAMTLLRGIADDKPLKAWLEENIWPAENRWLDEEFVRDGVRIACLEMLLSGTVAFSDMYFFDEVAGEVANEFGMRALLCAGIIDLPTKTTKGPDDCLRNAEQLYERFKDDDMVRPAIGAHSIYTCSPETLKKSALLARKRGMPIPIHLAETQWEVGEIKSRYGKTPVKHLDSIGFLADDIIAAHCVWLDPEDIELLSTRGVKVSHCIESNLKLASGIAPVPAMLKAGIPVSMGTDGAASNNDLDMFGEMRTAALVHKGVCNDPTCMDAYTVMKMATVEGARALGLDGTLTPGARADMVVLDTGGAHMAPVYDICSHIVYSAKASDVDTVMVAGRVLVESGQMLHTDEAAIIGKAHEWAERIRKNSG